jgi:hypothetical protein
MTTYACVGVIPLLILGWVGYVVSANELEKQSFNQLNAINAIKKSTISNYFQTINDQVGFLARDLMTIQAMRELSAAYAEFRLENNFGPDEVSSMREELRVYYADKFVSEYEAMNDGASVDSDALLESLGGDGVALQYMYIKTNINPLGAKHALDSANDASTYSQLHQKYHPVLRDFLQKFGYYDIFLVDANTGNVVYTTFKELDFATSLKDGAYADSNLGEAFRRANAATAKDSIQFVDFEQYLPSYDAAASFIAAPIYDGNEKLGILIFQMPLDKINAVMAERSGMGETG